MSRFTLLLLSSALMLIIAACDANGDDNAVDDLTDDTTEIPTDDATNGEDDTVIPEDDATGVEPADDEALATQEDDEAAAPEPDDDAMAQDDEMAFDDEEAVVDPDDLEPDPNQGMFFDLSVEEANDMTEFEVREPEYVPDSIEFQTIMGMASMEATQEEMGEEAATITFAYQQPPEDEMQQGLPVEFMQSSEIDMSEGLGPDAETEEVAIGDREVTRISIMAETGDEIIAFVWDDGGVHFSLAAMIGDELSEDDLEEMIASIPGA